MLKSFAARAVVPVALGVTVLVVASCALLYSVIKTDMINETIKNEIGLADTIIKSTRYAMLKGDRVTLHNIITNVGEQDSVEHVRIFNKKGLIMFSSRHDEVNRFVDKKAAGCIICHNRPVAATRMGRMEQARRYINTGGKHVLAITAPIYNEPDCSSASCHFHSSGQKILGTLDIGLSEEPLQKTLVVMGGRMVVFCVIVLVLAVGIISVLLRRNVLLPMKELNDYVNNVRLGQLDREPPHYNDEVGDVARSVQDMASRLNEALAELESVKGQGEVRK